MLFKLTPKEKLFTPFETLNSKVVLVTPVNVPSVEISIVNPPETADDSASDTLDWTLSVSLPSVANVGFTTSFFWHVHIIVSVEHVVPSLVQLLVHNVPSSSQMRLSFDEHPDKTLLEQS